jgi:hypothetical protein
MLEAVAVVLEAVEQLAELAESAGVVMALLQVLGQQGLLTLVEVEVAVVWQGLAAQAVQAS